LTQLFKTSVVNNDFNKNQAPGAGVAGSGVTSSAPGQFAWSKARKMADYASRAYSLGPFNSDEPTPTVIQDSKTDAQAIIVLNEYGNIIVAFKGSSCPRDFVQDAKARQVTELLWTTADAVAKVHTGFLEDFEAIAGKVVSVVRAMIATSGQATPVYITGHSLGGALAILCALEFARQKIPVAGVYTFGQPRVGNNVFAGIYNEALHDRTFRIVNQNDIVPRLPWVWRKYWHCGQLVFLPVGGGWALNPAWWTVVLSDVLGLYGAYRNREDVLIREHFIDAYQKRIEMLGDGDNAPLRDRS
jgi:triacylglycerol lipase